MICPIMSRPVAQPGFGIITEIFIQCKGVDCMFYRRYLNWQCEEMKVPLGSGYCALVLE
jgi:hypothetical protein